jgi:hypothetical protein
LKEVNDYTTINKRIVAILETIKGMNFPVIKETNFDFTGSQIP